MAHEHWPLFDLRIRTERLELRIPTDDDLFALVDVARAGIHGPDEDPFLTDWATKPSPEFERNFMQFSWRARAELSPEKWMLILAVSFEGRLVGTQGLNAENFAVSRAVSSGSWLGQAFQGQGIGKEMGAAMLHFVFDGLDAHEARSEAYPDNPASQRVSLAVGYEEDGSYLRSRTTGQVRALRYVMTSERWREVGPDGITMEGVEPCLGLLGLGS